MGQQDKARKIIAERFNFITPTKMAQLDIYGAADAAANSVRTKLGARVDRNPGLIEKNDTKMAYYTAKGPGGLISIMTMSLMTFPAKNGPIVAQLEVDDYTFQKGSMGMKPTINGEKMILKFVETLKTELAAA